MAQQSIGYKNKNQVALFERFFSIFLILIVFLLTSCGGGESVVENNETVKASDGTELTIKLVDKIGVGSQEIRSLDRNNSAIIIVTLRAANGDAIPNVIITFDADLAIIPGDGTALTDSSGVARITVVGGEVLGAGSVRATATVADGEIITASFGYAVGGITGSPSQVPSSSTSLTIKLIDDDGNEIRELEKNTSAIIEATLLFGGGQPIPNMVVTFSAELSELDPKSSTDLTDENGKARIVITPGQVLGAGTISALVSINDADLKVDYGYRVIADPNEPPAPPVIPSPSFTLKLIDDNGNEIRELERNASATIEATLLTGGGEAIANRVVTFSADLAELSPQSGTGLTDENGKATLTVTAGSSLGAGVVAATVSVNNIELEVDYGYSIFGVVDNAPPGASPAEPDVNDAVSKSNTGAINFVSASPSKIVLRKTGGEGLSEFSEITFRLMGSDNLPMEGKTVSFTLSKTTNIGGLAIDPLVAITNAEGLVKTILQAGSVPTVISVKAVANVQDINDVNQEVNAYSTALVVATGRPDQNSFSLSLDTLNPEAWDIDGTEVDVIARLGDGYNNWVPDGTSVYFTTEGGSIDASCRTIDNACTVKWVSQDPRPSDHRVTILATTLGSESFVDTDSDGVYTVADGEPYIDFYNNNVYDEPFNDMNGNNKFDEPFTVTGNNRWDPAELYVDTDNNGTWDSDEPLVDENGNGVWDDAEVFVDVPNRRYDLGEDYTDISLNDSWDVGEPFVDVANGQYDYGEIFTDRLFLRYQLGNLFTDYNNNGVYSGEGNDPSGETEYTERNGNGFYDGSGLLPGGDPLPTDFDLNGNGVFDGPGYADLGEPYLDANENNEHNFGEVFFDTNNNGVLDSGDGKYTGVLCEEGNSCSDKDELHLRDSVVLVMSGSNPVLILRDTVQDATYYSNDEVVRSNRSSVDISGGRSVTLIAYITDSAGQIMPADTQITVSADVGKLAGALSVNVSNTNQQYYKIDGAEQGRYYLSFAITDSDAARSDSGYISIRVNTPSGVGTTFLVPVRS